MSEWKAKRFWNEAGVVPALGGFTVELDGRPIRTPAKRPLILPTEAMAQAVAEEWQAQDGIVRPDTMPVTRTANSAIDKVALQRTDVVEMLAAYGDSDLLCYRAVAPAELVERESAFWDPMLDWAEAELGVRLETRVGVMPEPQKPEVLEILTRRTQALSDFQLAAFHDLVSLSGSLIIGFAAALGAHDIGGLWDMSRLDEIWQAEQWGQDDVAEEMAAVKKAAFVHAKRMFDLS